MVCNYEMSHYQEKRSITDTLNSPKLLVSGSNYDLMKMFLTTLKTRLQVFLSKKRHCILFYMLQRTYTRNEI